MEDTSLVCILLCSCSKLFVCLFLFLRSLSLVRGGVWDGTFAEYAASRWWCSWNTSNFLLVDNKLLNEFRFQFSRVKLEKDELTGVVSTKYLLLRNHVLLLLLLFFSSCIILWTVPTLVLMYSFIHCRISVTGEIKSSNASFIHMNLWNNGREALPLCIHKHVPAQFAVQVCSYAYRNLPIGTCAYCEAHIYRFRIKIY